MWLMDTKPLQPKMETIQIAPLPAATPERIAEVEGALSPYIPALEAANPGSAALLNVGTHPDYWIAYFRRPMLRDHVGLLYPTDVAAEITAILARLDPNQRC